MKRRYGIGAVAALPDGEDLHCDIVLETKTGHRLLSYDSNSGQYLPLHTYQTDDEAVRHLHILVRDERPVGEVARYHH